MKISEISEQFYLITDTFEVAKIQNDLHLDMQDCDGLFVKLDIEGSDYEIVYGFEGIIPKLDKDIFLLFPNQDF